MVKNRQKIFRRKSFWALCVVLAAVGVVAVLELTNTTYLLHKKVVPATIPAKSQESEAKKSASKNSGDSKQKDTDEEKTKIASSAGGTGSNLPLIEPFGSLVSNHTPGQNGSDTKEQSTCNTTPGATCYIEFTHTSNGKVTRLPSQTTGSDGSTGWSWDAKTLTAGQWEVKAVASLNGQTKSVTDNMKLEVR